MTIYTVGLIRTAKVIKWGEYEEDLARKKPKVAHIDDYGWLRQYFSWNRWMGRRVEVGGIAGLENGGGRYNSGAAFYRAVDWVVGVGE